MSEQPLDKYGATNVAAVSPTRIMLVDDHLLVRQALREMLASEPDLTICGEAGDEATARSLFTSTLPHLVLLDLSLGESSGLDLLPWMIQTHPEVHVLVLSMHDATLYAERAIRAGACGYINKRDTSDAIVTAIRTVLAGNIYLHPATADPILQRLTSSGWEPVPQGKAEL